MGNAIRYAFSRRGLHGASTTAREVHRLAGPSLGNVTPQRAGRKVRCAPECGETGPKRKEPRRSEALSGGEEASGSSPDSYRLCRAAQWFLCHTLCMSRSSRLPFPVIDPALDLFSLPDVAQREDDCGRWQLAPLEPHTHGPDPHVECFCDLSQAVQPPRAAFGSTVVES